MPESMDSLAIWIATGPLFVLNGNIIKNKEKQVIKQQKLLNRLFTFWEISSANESPRL